MTNNKPNSGSVVGWSIALATSIVALGVTIGTLNYYSVPSNAWSHLEKASAVLCSEAYPPSNSEAKCPAEYVNMAIDDKYDTSLENIYSAKLLAKSYQVSDIGKLETDVRAIFQEYKQDEQLSPIRTYAYLERAKETVENYTHFQERCNTWSLVGMVFSCFGIVVNGCVLIDVSAKYLDKLEKYKEDAPDMSSSE
jgi:hypothetical protein